MTNVTSYNLADLTAAQAQEKGETFFRIWKQFQRREMVRLALARRQMRTATGI